MWIERQILGSPRSVCRYIFNYYCYYFYYSRVSTVFKSRKGINMVKKNTINIY